MQTKSILLIILAALALIVLLQNTDMVYLRFLFFSVGMPQIILTALLLLIGFFAGYLTATWLKWKRGGAR
jgi:uncharacterized integral membrane protein